MLEMKLKCEHCNKKLPKDSSEAMICSFKCTFCKACAEDKFQHKCPYCHGEFVRRPKRNK